ncbi:hypothetical protein BH24ACT3_BH24ACT3_16230 [soil metagenome]
MPDHRPPHDAEPPGGADDPVAELVGRLADHAPPPPAFAGILAAARDHRSTAMERSTPRWIAAAVLALVVAAGAFLVLRDDGDGDERVDVVADEGTSTTGSTEPTSPETTTQAPATTTTTLELPAEPAIDGQFETLAASGGQHLAVGRAADGTYLWRSDDGGASWTPVPQPIVFEGADLLDLAGTDDGFVAVAASPEGDPIVARSPDGAQWELLTDAPDTFCGDVPLAIARDADGFVVVAQTFGEANEPIGGSLWTSPDGATWTGGPNEAFADVGEGTITDGFTNPEGGVGFVGFDPAGGFVLLAGGDPAAVDGVTRPEVFAASTVQGVTANEGVLIAAGERQPSGAGAVTWISEDGGETWEVLADADAFGPETGLVGVATGGGDTVAVGRAGEASAAWVLTGDTWQRR